MPLPELTFANDFYQYLLVAFHALPAVRRSRSSTRTTPIASSTSISLPDHPPRPSPPTSLCLRRRYRCYYRLRPTPDILRVFTPLLAPLLPSLRFPCHVNYFNNRF